LTLIAPAAFFIAQALVPSPSPSPGPSTSGGPTPAAAPQPVPIQASATPAGSPGPAGSPLPAPTSTTTPNPYTYRFVPRQPDHVAPGTPQIFAVYLNSQQLHSLGPILIKVSTSPDVVKVVSENGSSAGIVPMVSPGDFEATGKLPKVPFIASGIGIYIDFIATGPTGVKTTVRVPVKII
jgi:hypothetical protein